MVKLNSSTWISVEDSQSAAIGQDLWLELSSSLYSGCTHHQEERKMFRGNESHINWHQFPFLSWVFSILFLLLGRATSAHSSRAALSFGPSRILLSGMCCFQYGHLYARSLIWVSQRSIRRSHCSGLPPCMQLMLMDWAITQTHSLAWLSFLCVFKPPVSCPIPGVSAAHGPTLTASFLSQTRTCWVGIWIVLSFAIIHFGDQVASDYTLSSQRWRMIESWKSSVHYSKQPLGVLNI